jgi:molecular chaperone DnaK (HSP70)
LSTDGDHHLGGVDWDTEIVNYVLSNCCGVDERYEDIKDTKDGGTLILAAEQCKKLLLKNTESPMRFRYKNRMYTKAIKRSTFEELTSDLLQKTIDVVHHAISISTDRNATIDEIILVGGSSYMPMVKNKLIEEFPNTEVRLDQFEPDLAVAKGAAIHAYNLANPLFVGVSGGVKILQDLSSRSYGIASIDYYTGENVVENLVLRTDPIVYGETILFQTTTDGQDSVDISIFESASSERTIPRYEGKMIASKTISWGYPVPIHTTIVARVKRESNGIVSIEVECQNKKVSFELKPENALDEDKMDNLKKEISSMQFF